MGVQDEKIGYHLPERAGIRFVAKAEREDPNDAVAVGFAGGLSLVGGPPSGRWFWKAIAARALLLPTVGGNLSVNGPKRKGSLLT
jgi:hypothetical protein